MTSDPNKIPVWLRRTPEQQASDDALQSRLKQVYGPGLHLSPTERHLKRADMVERSALAQLDHLSSIDNPPGHQLNTAKGQLAEAWAMQGKFREAAELHPSPAHAKRFLDIANAIDVDDKEVCECQPERAKHPVTGQTITLHHENVDEIIFSPKHKRLMPLVRCKCGFLNVKHAPVHLQRRIDNIKRAE